MLRVYGFALDSNLYNESLEQTIAVNISLDNKINLVICQCVQLHGRDASPCQLPFLAGKQDAAIRGKKVPSTVGELPIL